MKFFFLIPLLIWGTFAFGQLNDTFTDGNLSANPTWSGSNSSNDFIVTTEQLRSNSTTTNSNFYLSTASALATNCQWEFWINLQFNPSSANYVDVYLTSDQSNLQSASINGYFVRVGNTNDEICLYKRAGSTITKLIDGADGILNTSNNKAKIRITRTAANQFTLERDLTGLGTSYVTEGTLQDATFTTSAYFGIFIQQSTSGFFQKHFLDDFKISSLITDNTPPRLSSATVVDSTTLQVIFDEALDSTAAKLTANYTINTGYGNPTSIKTTSDESKYLLKLSKGLNTGTYQLTATGIKDKAGNTIASNNSASFSYIKPFVAKKGDLVINEIFADPSPQIDLPSVEFIEIYNTFNQTIQLKNWRYSDPVSTASFPVDSIKSGEYLILCAKADTNEFKRFGKTIGISPWPSLNNSSDVIKLVSPENRTIDSVAYSDSWYPSALKKQGGWSLERINYKSLCNGIFNWAASSDVTGGTPGKQNSAFIGNYDQMTFKADSIKQLSDSTISVYFNKPADFSSNASFTLSPNAGNIKSVVPDSYARQTALVFSNKFTPNTSYQLSISQLKDCAGNTIAANFFSFSTPKVPPVRLDTAKIYITEIFADPSPEVKLPLAEFVEIYNPDRDTIDLDGWTFNNSKTKSTIKKTVILPNESLILCSASDSAQYKSFGKTIGLSIWPTLTNTADQLVLKSFKGRMVDSIAYSDTWHTNSIKKQGGWSLERIDYSSVCGGRFNWVSSVDTTGGTPGRRNSVYIANYDKMALTADSIQRQSDSTLTVFFNKSVDLSTTIGAFNLIPESGAIKSSFNPNSTQANLIFSKPFVANTSYKLQIGQLKDCSGNLLNTSFQFTTPKSPPVRPDTAKLYITEFLADPSPEVKLPLVEFVEVFNAGRDTINLDGYTLGNSKTKTTIKKAAILPNEYLILCPSADTIQYKSSGKVAGINSWPTLTNTADQIVLKSFKGRLIDSLSYSDSWHSNSIKKQGGWSMERIDYSSVCGGAFNWISSIDSTGGTPGRANSVCVFNYDKLAFKADSIRRLSDSTITIYLNKPADLPTATNAFSLSPLSGTIRSAFYSNSRQVNLSFDKPFLLNTSYQLTISQLKDCAGNPLNTSFQFTTPKPSPVTVRQDTAKLYFTEIFADPSPEVKLPLVEFIEIFNPGKDTVDMEGYTLSNSKSKTIIKKTLILPNAYLILCPAADTTQYKTFGKVAGISSWPVLTNASDQVVLKSFKNRLVDSITYFDAWHSNSIKKQGGWTLERVDYRSVCGNAFNWTSSIDPSGGTPGRQNSVNIPNYDRLIFEADSLKQLSETSVDIYFNKHTDVSSSAVFTFSPAVSLKSVSFDVLAKKATLVCNDRFQPNTTYTLNAVQLKDCAGNNISSNTVSFTTPKAPRPIPVRADTAKIYFTEIFADPSPEIKLPLAEFVEIYNLGTDTVDLDGWSFNDPVTKSLFKKSVILPHQYVILCPAADTVQFKPFGKTIGVTPWPSLNNVSDQITLKSFTGRLVDSVSYKDTWYKNDTKKSGGWSLELVDHASVCQGTQNWMASTDSTGGTPGRQNSVHQLFNSLEPLRVVQARLKDSTSIMLLFNRPADSLLAANPSNYNVNNGVGKPFGLVINPSFSSVELKFRDPLTRGNTYKISCQNLSDCGGTSMLPSNNWAELFYPDKISKADILISEILFNPRSGGSDFVEVYNNSDKLLDLKELTLATIKVPDSITSKKAVSASTLFLQPKHYLVLTTDPDNIKKEYRTENPDAFLKMTSLPSFNNDKGSVVLLSGESLIDRFDYSEKMHSQSIKDAKGVSLERSSFTAPANEPGNFRSAAWSVGYASPGYKNSQQLELDEDKHQQVDLVSKTFSPDNDGFEDVLQINYHFSEPGMIANASIYNNKGSLIRRIAKNATLAAEGTLIWDGLTENTQKAPVGVYIVYFDVFSLSGKTKTYRKACVLATKLN